MAVNRLILNSLNTFATYWPYFLSLIVNALMIDQIIFKFVDIEYE